MSTAPRIIATRYAEKLATAIERMSHDGGFSSPEGLSILLDYLLVRLTPGRTKEEAEALVEKRFCHHSPAGLVALEQVAGIFEEAVKGQPFHDHLGNAYMQLASRSGKQALGQFFTPREVSVMMAELAFNDNPNGDPDLPYIRAMEPSCGGGSMILAAAEVYSRRPGATKPLVWMAIDLDRMCARMAGVQAAAHRIPAVVVCGDSLRWGCEGYEEAELVWPPIPGRDHVTEGQAAAILDYMGRCEAGEPPLGESEAAS